MATLADALRQLGVDVNPQGQVAAPGASPELLQAAVALLGGQAPNVTGGAAAPPMQEIEQPPRPQFGTGMRQAFRDTHHGLGVQPYNREMEAGGPLAQALRAGGGVARQAADYIRAGKPEISADFAAAVEAGDPRVEQMVKALGGPLPLMGPGMRPRGERTPMAPDPRRRRPAGRVVGGGVPAAIGRGAGGGIGRMA